MTEVGNASFGTAIETVEAAAASGIPLRLIGGLAIRYLTPDYPPRVRNDQDMDFASVSTAKNDVIQFLDERGRDRRPPVHVPRARVQGADRADAGDDRRDRPAPDEAPGGRAERKGRP